MKRRMSSNLCQLKDEVVVIQMWCSFIPPKTSRLLVNSFRTPSFNLSQMTSMSSVFLLDLLLHLIKALKSNLWLQFFDYTFCYLRPIEPEIFNSVVPMDNRYVAIRNRLIQRFCEQNTNFTTYHVIERTDIQRQRSINVFVWTGFRKWKPTWYTVPLWHLKIRLR